jgi:hypothetical protein
MRRLLAGWKDNIKINLKYRERRVRPGFNRLETGRTGWALVNTNFRVP